MRQAVSISLIMLFTWQLLLKGGVLLWYGINKSYIAAELCKNRDKPELKCNGKCILAQRIKAAEQERKDAQERPLRIIEKLEFSHFVVTLSPLQDILFSTYNAFAVWRESSPISGNHVFRLLHPPE